MRIGFKRYLPRTLFVRSLMIIIIPVVLTHIISGYIFFERHWSYVTRVLSHNIAGQISVTTQLLEKKAITLEEAERLASKNFEMSISHSRNSPINIKGIESLGVFFLEQSLEQTLDRPYRVWQENKDLRVWVKGKNGKGYVYEIPAKRLVSSTTLLFFLWSLGSSIVLLTIAIIFMRNQLKPLYRLSQWAERMRHGITASITKIEGAREIRKVASAVQFMTWRLQKNFEERSKMLMGISHDLRTPLTRIRLQLQLMPASEERRELKKDVEQMIAMVEAYLAFARGRENESFEFIDLEELVRKLIKVVGGKKRITFTSFLPAGYRIRGLPLALQRCITNLLDNAQRYAKSTIRVSVSLHKRVVRLSVEDDGPGIAPQFYEEIFKPFYRLDKGRNLEGHNVGLGLSIAKGIVLQHGGKIEVGASHDLEGTAFMITLPAKLSAKELFAFPKAS